MKMQSSINLLLIAIACAGLVGCGESVSGHTDDDGHGHAAETAGRGEHGEGHDEHGEDEHGEHGEEVVRLTRAQLGEAGVEIRPLSGGVITTHITLPAEVGLNMDTVVHVTPRVPGIVSEVQKYLGDRVDRNAVLAVIESPELGEAKIAYLQAKQSLLIAEADLKRQQTISENTAKLLELLSEEPSLVTLREAAAGLRIGENKGRLLSAYAKTKAAEANYARERDLREKNLSTEADLLAAQEAYNSSLADYFAAYEDIDFMYQVRLDEARRAAGIAKSEVENAERRLHLLGLTDEQIRGIAEEPGADVARYELLAPIEGRIVEKHLAPGEKISDDQSVYTIADLSTVWLNISVYTEYADQIREGHRVVVHAGDRTADGVVDYVSSVVSEGTRTVSARVVIDNSDRAWKPGEFVTARVETAEVRVPRAVPIEAIQTYEGGDVVFVQDEEGFRPFPVRLGLRNDTNVEILGDDLPLGTPIVVKNSFLLKADLGKSAAGHEH